MNFKSRKKNIYLIGFMGSGKTTIGRQLAEKLAKPFYDSDVELEKHVGVNIEWIFEELGEPGFREKERYIIAKLTKLSGIVMSTGGGAILEEDNRRKLKENGFVIYLKAQPKHLYARTKLKGEGRPLLNCDHPKKLQERIASLLKKREPLYQGAADLVLQTDCDNVHHIVQMLCDEYNKYSV